MKSQIAIILRIFILLGITLVILRITAYEKKYAKNTNTTTTEREVEIPQGAEVSTSSDKTTTSTQDFVSYQFADDTTDDVGVNYDDIVWTGMKEKMTEQEYADFEDYLPVLYGEVEVHWTTTYEAWEEGEESKGCQETLKELLDHADQGGGSYDYFANNRWHKNENIREIQMGDMIGNDGKQELILGTELNPAHILIYKYGDAYYGTYYARRSFQCPRENGYYWAGKERGSYQRMEFDGKNLQENIMAQISHGNDNHFVYEIAGKKVTEKDFHHWEKENVDNIKEITTYYELPMRKYNDMKINTKTWTKSYKEGLDLCYTYPKIKGTSQAAKKINTFFAQQRKQWIAEHASVRKAAKKDEMHYSDDIDYVIVYQNEECINVMQTGYRYYGGGHGMPYRISTIFSVETGDVLTPMDILEQNKTEINEHVKQRYLEKWEKEKTESGLWEPEMIEEELNSDFVDETLYYLYEGKLIFFAPPYRLGSFAAGFIEVEY